MKSNYKDQMQNSTHSLMKVLRSVALWSCVSLVLEHMGETV